MKKTWLISCLLTVSCLSLFAQDDSSPTLLVNKLKSFNQTRPAEKAYLHFDKPYYAAGDTIYFKAYTVMGERLDLSRISGVLHVELINAKNKIDQSIKLQLVNGLANGDFALPDSLPAGNYRIRAYTRWMRNEGEDGFFEKTIPVGSVEKNKVAESAFSNNKPGTDKPEVQFLPEGGELLTGISCKIAFKATGASGLGIAVQGVITDNFGKNVATFNSAHLGMGSFELKPEYGKTYQAMLTFADGSRDNIYLPQVKEKGIVLQITDDDQARALIRDNGY